MEGLARVIELIEARLGTFVSNALLWCVALSVFSVGGSVIVQFSLGPIYTAVVDLASNPTLTENEYLTRLLTLGYWVVIGICMGIISRAFAHSIERRVVDKLALAEKVKADAEAAVEHCERVLARMLSVLEKLKTGADRGEDIRAIVLAAEIELHQLCDQRPIGAVSPPAP